MTDVQPQAPLQAPTAINASQSGSAGSPVAASGQSSVNSLPSAHQPSRSYAHATKSSISGSVATPSTTSSVDAGTHNGKQGSVNSKNRAANMAAPPVAINGPSSNGNANPSDHSRKPSVTISAAGASGNIPNGGPATPSTRHNINFGQMPVGGGSPAIANSQPYQQQTSSLPTPARDPRITSPAASPSPIPQPAASGGRPPQGLPQGNGLSFGSMPGGQEGDMSRQIPGASPQPLMPSQMPAHFRRASSQSQHGEMPYPGMSMGPGAGRGGYTGGSRGGRNSYSGFPQQTPHTPSQRYSQQMPGQRPMSNLPPHFQGHMMGGPHPGSPNMGPPRSPGPMASSQPGTPNMHQMHMAQQMGYPPQYATFQNQLSPQPGQFGEQPSYDPNFAYYSGHYSMHPNYMPPGPPQSPRQLNRPPPSSQQPYFHGQHNQAPSQNMSRTSSQVSERPASSLGSAQHASQQPGTPAGSHVSHTPSQSTSGAASSNFIIPPKRASKGIIIKNAAGDVLNFDDAKKPSPSPATAVAPSPSPANTTTTPTPPPPSATSATHTRSDSSKASKTPAEIKAMFQEQVKKGQEKDKQTQEEPTTVPEKAEPSISETQPEATDDKSVPSAPLVVGEPSPVQPEEKAAEPTQPPLAESASDKSAEAGESDEAREKRLQDEETERMIAEMEANEREEEEREKAFQEKKAKEKAEQAEREKAAGSEDALKKAEREAEAAEEAREKERQQDNGQTQENESAESKAENEELFASLKRPDIGPGATAVSGAETPKSEDSAAPGTPVAATPSAKVTSGARPKPAALKLETAKNVEPAQPTPGMRSLRSARMLSLQSESIAYPKGISSPNPALNANSRRAGRLYDKSFLLQFQDAFKEKPGLDWDQKVKETVGDVDVSTPKTGRPAPTPRSAKPPPSAFNPPMGTIGTRTLPPGTTSADRFRESNSARPGMAFARPGGGQNPMGAPIMGGSGMRMMPPNTMQPRQNTGRIPSKGSSRRGASRQENFQDDKKMPLTSKGDIKGLEVSGGGWKPTSIGGQGAAAPDLSGNLAPDMVQRKVKSNLNKMTPERFEKIADQILAIASQSKSESDGRTLRQVIALTFEKACDEAHWASMYAKFCQRMLQDMSVDIKDDNARDKNGNPLVGGPLFRKYLLNRCQEEFERGWQINLPEQTEEAAMLSDEYYIAEAAKRKGLGLVQFIGELYKLGMLSIRIMHECFTKLLDFEGTPDEAAIEGLVKLLRTVGFAMQTEPNGPPLIKTYFERIDKIMNKEGLPSRMYFMLLDTVDLRRKDWRSAQDTKGPKTIQEIRAEAAEAEQKAATERARQSQNRGGGRMGPRGDNRNFSGGMMGPPPDFQRNTVGTDDLRKLGQKNMSRQSSQNPAKSLGPTSMFASRSSSGRTGLGPQGGLMSRGHDSSPGSSLHSRSASVKAEKKEDDSKASASANAFSALAGMEGDGTGATPGSSPPTTKAQPATSQPTVKPESSKPTEQSKPDTAPTAKAGDS
ncbi:MAG: hypothetical protein M1828_001868 [Chrysothrix sp. TS-e1954]|nr:MAG: hypothetical protein M1828_001868 [Chrysothrix sp. TS-e1954]